MNVDGITLFAGAVVLCAIVFSAITVQNAPKTLGDLDFPAFVDYSEDGLTRATYELKVGGDFLQLHEWVEKWDSENGWYTTENLYKQLYVRPWV